MFKIPNTLPTRTAHVEELTDFLECECIKRGSISFTAALKPIKLVGDEVNRPGIEDESDKLNEKIEDILTEIDRRSIACNGRYPFLTLNRGYGMRVSNRNTYYWIYAYLLFSTRLDMIADKVLHGIDGTKILEKLSAIVAKEYFGDRARSLVFGTANEELTVFEDKVNNLCACMGEGHSFLNRNLFRPRANDDKLDVAVWKDFTDGNHSKMIGFGQCKTGTSWDDKETIELQPIIFCEKWMRDTPISPPIKMFFTSQYFPIDDYSKAKNAGLVFDRFRLMDFLPERIFFNRAFMREVRVWTYEAISKYK